MDKNQATGLIILAIFLMAYFYWFAPKPEDLAKTEQTDSTEVVEKRTPDTVTANQPTTPVETTEEPDSIKDQQIYQQYGPFATVANGEEEIVTLENEVVSIDFSTKGGLWQTVRLKEYEDQNYETVVLMTEESAQLDQFIQINNGRINLSELYFEASEPYSKNDTTYLDFTLAFEGGTIKRTFGLPPKGYQVLWTNKSEGLQRTAIKDDIHYVWRDDLKPQEINIDQSRMYSSINFNYINDGHDDLGNKSNSADDMTFDEPVTWLSFKQKFFTSAIIPEKPIKGGQITITPVAEEDTTVVKKLFATFPRPIEYMETAEGEQMRLYFGPNKYNILKKVTVNFEKNIDLGWPIIREINRWLIIPLFNFFEKFIPNYGIVIILLVFVIRLIISPLTYKSQIQMAKTKVLQPEMAKIKEQFPDDMQKQQSETMKLYQKVGVNPLSGCIPLLLQMPILFAMFQFIPNAIELRHKSFLWAEDLSTYDSILSLPFSIPGYGDHVSLFTLLMTLSTLLITQMSSSQMAANTPGPMKSMQYIMPFIFLFVLNGYPAGLTYYYFISNLVSYGQMKLIRRFVDDEKIKEILEKNKARNANKKKSKFQQRLEEAMKAQEETKKSKKKR
jgi:YidC/Oxa1 family membrane protein insertase